MCGNKEFKKRTGQVRDNPDLEIMECISCGLIFLSSFYHINKDFYEQSRIHEGLPDIKAWLEETARDDDRRFVFLITYWSCHLFLFTRSTLASVAEKAGLKVNYVKQVQRYPLSNHLYWLAKGKPDGHKIWGFLDSEALNKAYEAQLASINLCDMIIASFSKG